MDINNEPFKTPPIQLVNNFDEQTAHIVKQYPYQGRLTRQRHWVETRPGYGQRHVVQNMDPHTSKWLGVKPTMYFNIVILTTVIDTDHILCGQVTPHFFTVSALSNPELFELAIKYSYTPHQRTCILNELNKRNFTQPPPWKEEPIILLRTATRHETVLPREMRVERLTTPEGIVCETFEAANKRIRKERRAAKETQQTPTTTTPSLPAGVPTLPIAFGNSIDNPRPDLTDSVDDMTPEQHAMWELLSQPVDPNS